MAVKIYSTGYKIKCYCEWIFNICRIIKLHSFLPVYTHGVYNPEEAENPIITACRNTPFSIPPKVFAMPINKQVLLAARPKGEVKEADFRVVEVELPALADGEIRVQNHFLSLDPYMRGRMDDAKSYAVGVKLGEVMTGGTVGEVVESNNPKFARGDRVLSMSGWQQYAQNDGRGMQKIDTSKLPMSVYLGSVGMPGVTAWYGLKQIGKPK